MNARISRKEYPAASASNDLIRLTLPKIGVAVPDEFDAAIHLNRQVIDGIESLAANREYIAPIVEAAKSASLSASIMGLSKKIARKTRIPRRIVEDVLLALFNLRSISEDFKGGAAFGLIHEALKRDTGITWQKEYLAKWLETVPEVESVVDSITDDHPIAVAQKANQLSFSHQNVLAASRIVTDLRPVFDESGERVLETIVFHTLVLQYISGHHTHSEIHIALDSEDVEDLLKACQRAQGKSRAIKKEFADKNPILLPD